MKYSLSSLREKFKNGEQPKLLFFWGHTPSKDGTIGKSCFSQWWKVSFVKEGEIYKTAEHFMMAEKARLFEDKETRTEIIACEHPAEAKRLGRKVFKFNAEVWDEHKYAIVKEGNFLKFSQHLDLKDFLLKTNERVLVEASPIDVIWGIGLSHDDPRALNPTLWEGDNLLGFALMEVRDKLNEIE